MIRKFAFAALAALILIGPAAALWQATQVSVTAAGVQILPDRVGRKAVVLINHGTTDVWIGTSSDVTSTTGILLNGTKGTTLRLENIQTAVYGAATASQTISVVEEY